MLGKFSFIIDSGFLCKFAIVAFAFVLSSCAYTRNIAPWSLWPGDWGKDASDNPTALIMDIKERGIYTRKVKQKDEGERMVLCAEPSPDALSATSGAGNAGYGGATLGVQVATTAAYVGLRTQTIQLLRDAMYRLCEATLNEQISKGQYMELFKALEDDMITLLAIEQLTGAVRAPPVVIYGEIKTTKPATKADSEQTNTKGGGTFTDTMIKVEPFNPMTAREISGAVLKILNSREKIRVLQMKISEIKANLVEKTNELGENRVKRQENVKRITINKAKLKTNKEKLKANKAKLIKVKKELERKKVQCERLKKDDPDPEAGGIISAIQEFVFSETEEDKKKRITKEKIEREELAQKLKKCDSEKEKLEEDNKKLEGYNKTDNKIWEEENKILEEENKILEEENKKLETEKNSLELRINDLKGLLPLLSSESEEDEQESP